MRTSLHDGKAHRWFITPSIITILILNMVPLLFACWIMLNDANLLENQGRFIFTGLKNFRTFLEDPRVLNSFLVTLRFIAGALAGELLLGLFVSLLVDRKFRFKKIIRALLVIPMFMTPVVSGLIWRAFFDPNAGIVSYLHSLLFGTGIDMLGNTNLALIAIIIVDIWQGAPFFIIFILASLDGIPQDATEAALVEGASEFQIIQYIKLPAITPTLIVATIMRLIDLMKTFDIVYVMTKGGPGISTEIINMYTYTIGFKWYRIGYATTVAFIFALLISLFLGISNAKVSRFVEQE